MRRTILILAAALVSFGLAAQADATPSEMKRKVIGELERYYLDPTFDITIEEPGRVRVDGTVESYWRKQRITELVSRVDGVKQIENRLTVQSAVVADAVIRESLEADLKRNERILEPEHIRVGVNNGTVVLTGIVNFPEEHAMAEEIASWQEGVRGVINELKIIPAPFSLSDGNLKDLARDVLRRFFPREADAVTVSIEDGWVTLDGNVPNLWAKHAIADEIRELRGVHGMTNELTVTDAH